MAKLKKEAEDAKTRKKQPYDLMTKVTNKLLTTLKGYNSFLGDW